MLDFNTVYKKHGEQFLYSILDQWERDYKVSHKEPLSLKARWSYFIRATEYKNAVAA